MHHHYEAFFFALSCAIKCNQRIRRACALWKDISGTQTFGLLVSRKRGGPDVPHRRSLLGTNVTQKAEKLLKRKTFPHHSRVERALTLAPF